MRKTDKTSDITVKELEEQIHQCYIAKEEHNAAHAISSAAKDKLDRMKEETIAIMQELGMNSYRAKSGLFTVVEKPYFYVPKDDINKAKFFAYLKERGVFDDMISVRADKFNSWAKVEDIRLEKEGVLDYQVPGMEKATRLTASMTKVK